MMGVDTSTWPRTARGKLVCPDCGGTGWPVNQAAGPSWLDKHRHHTECPDCGKVVAVRGLPTHRRHCR